MAADVSTLAERFEQASQALIALLEQCSEREWRSLCAVEGWPVGVTAHHVAVDHPVLARLVRAAATGQRLEANPPEEIDRLNARHAVEHADCGKAETLALLRRGGGEGASVIRHLSSEQLGRRAQLGDAHLTVAQLIESVLIGHIDEHRASIQAALGRG